MDGDSAPVVLLSEVELEPGVKVECVSKFCYLGDTLGSGGGVVEAARARVRCAWAKFKELSPILTVRGASYRIKGRIYSACVQSVLICAHTDSNSWHSHMSELALAPEHSELLLLRFGTLCHSLPGSPLLSKPSSVPSKPIFSPLRVSTWRTTSASDSIKCSIRSSTY